MAAHGYVLHNGQTNIMNRFPNNDSVDNDERHIRHNVSDEMLAGPGAHKTRPCPVAYF